MSFTEQHEAEAERFAALFDSTHIDGLKAAKRRIDDEISKRAGDPLWRTKIMPDSWYEILDEGIRFPVRVLHAAGLETCQSCQGGEGHDMPHPTIHLPSPGRDADGFHALAALASYGIDVLHVGIQWSVVQGMPTDRVWSIELRRAYPERATEKPNFVYACLAQ